MKRCAYIKTAALALLLAGSALFGQSAEEDPILNFGISTPRGGVIKSWTPGVSITPGTGAEVLNGPLGTRALIFDGTEKSISTFNLDGNNTRLRKAKNITVAFALRVDEAPATPVKTGLGITIHGDKISLSDGNFNLDATVKIQPMKWYQIAYSYSVDGKNAKLYVDGSLDNVAVNAPLKKLNVNFERFGGFKGGLASIQAWDRALDDKDVLTLETDARGIEAMTVKLEDIQRQIRLKQIDPYLEDVKKDLARVKRRKFNPISLLEKTQYSAYTALKLAQGEYFFRGTSLAKAPFSLIQVRATASYLRRADVFPEDAIFTANLCTAAAKGEYEPVSFVIYPYQPMDKVNITVSDFKSTKGATLPASILDRKIVKNWYQASWNSQYNNVNQILVPDLLVNDVNLVKVDEVTGKNYLRVGDKYVDVNGTESAQFNFCKEDVKDAPVMQDVAMVPGKGTQFWFTYHVPRDAKPGLYKATATVTNGGEKVADFTLSLRVYPFELPAPKTSYNVKKDWIISVSGGADLSRYAALADEATAEKFFRRELENLRAHGVTQPAVPFGANTALFEKDLKIRKEMGFDLNGVFVSAFPNDGTLVNQFAPAGTAAPDFDAFSKKISSMSDSFKRIAGHKNFYFYGVEGVVAPEDAGKFYNFICKDNNILSAGWSNDLFFLPTKDLFYAHSGAPDDYLAEKWHALEGRIISSGCYFTGPDNPDYMRRELGIKLYRKRYDGLHIAAFPSLVNCWNERTAPGIFRNQVFAYPTSNGIINTIAFEGFREGIDDVRYLTLLRSLLEESFAIKNWDAIYASKKGVAVFELLNTSKMDLDLMRMEVADHIVTIMKRLGKEVE